MNKQAVSIIPEVSAYFYALDPLYLLTHKMDYRQHFSFAKTRRSYHFPENSNSNHIFEGKKITNQNRI